MRCHRALSWCAVVRLSPPQVPLSPGHDLDELWSVVLVGLLRVVRRATAGWPTTLADDGALLESPGLSHDRTTAVTTRVRFKTIVTTLEVMHIRMSVAFRNPRGD